MPERTTPYPLPDPVLSTLPPEELAGVGVSIVRRVYSVELDAAHGPARLDGLVRERFRPGRYTMETFPNVLALALGAHLGVMLRHRVPDGQWGASSENLYRTPLPFLLFSRGEYARQINVVEDYLTLMWTGDGLYPTEYFAYQTRLLGRLGFAAESPRLPTHQ